MTAHLLEAGASRQVVVRERMTITGAFDPDSFVPWIDRYASKLGLMPKLVAAGRGRVEVEVAGEAELIELLAIGCSLGPIGVQVDSIDHDVLAACDAPVRGSPATASKVS